MSYFKRGRPFLRRLITKLLFLLVNFGGVLLLGQCGSKVYVDESSLLAGFASPSLSEFPPSEPLSSIGCSDSISPIETLRAQFEMAGASVEVYETHAPANCSCTSMVATVRAARGDGLEAFFMSIEVGDATDLTDATSSRAFELAHRLARHLHVARWLAKDVIFFLHPRCACACGTNAVAQDDFFLASDWPACPHGPVTKFIEGCLAPHALPSRRTQLSHGKGDLGAKCMPGAADRQPCLRSSLLRQVISFSLRATRGSGQPRALAVELGGIGGRLPNLDLYAALWKAAGHSAVGVPLELLSTRGTGAHARSLAFAFTPWLAHILGTLYEQLRLDEALAAFRFTLNLAWGAPRGEHAKALAFGVDGLSLSAAQPWPGGDLRPELSDMQIVSLLLGLVRSLSNLCEALHHSHYTYLLGAVGTLMPFKFTAALLHLPPLVFLAILMVLHRRNHLAAESTGEAPASTATGKATCVGSPTFSIACIAVAASHSFAMSVLLLPPLSPYWLAVPIDDETSLPRPLPVPAWALLASMTACWGTIAGTLTQAARWRPIGLSCSAVSTVACLTAGCLSVVFSCLSLHLGMVGSMVLATLSFAIPMPSANPTANTLMPGGSRRGLLVHVLYELTMFVLLSPCALLLTIAYLALGKVCPLRALEVAWQLAATHGTLPYAFACAACVPFSALIGSMRLQRLLDVFGELLLTVSN